MIVPEPWSFDAEAAEEVVAAVDDEAAEDDTVSAARIHVYLSHGQLLSCAHCSNSRCPRNATLQHVPSLHGQSIMRKHFSTSRCHVCHISFSPSVTHLRHGKRGTVHHCGAHGVSAGLHDALHVRFRVGTTQSATIGSGFDYSCIYYYMIKR